MNKPSRPTQALEQFAPMFAEMEPPLQTVLTGLLAELQGFEDLISLQHTPEHGSFLGYDGVENRGDVSDILTSEWAVYDLDRTEFLRRVAMRETLFRSKQFEVEGGGRAVCAMVDAGAWMLGQNRLLALASLFWLAGLAERQGLDFHWCDSSNPDWNEGLTRAQVERYLGRISQREVSAEWVETQSQTLPILPDVTPEMWFIGHNGAQDKMVMDSFRVALLAGRPVRTVPDAGAESSVSFLTRGALRRESIIAYPDDGTCIGALRRPFAPPRPKSLSSAEHLTDEWFQHHWLQMGHRGVIVRWPDGLVMLPQIPTTQPAIWIPLPGTARIIACHWSFSAVTLTWMPDPSEKQISTLVFDPKDLKKVQRFENVALTGDDVDLDFPATALPAQEKEEAFFDVRGNPYTLDVQTGKVTRVKGPRLLKLDGWRAIATASAARHPDSVDQLTHQRHKTHRLSILADPDFADLADKPRDVRVAESDNAVMASTDGCNYRVWPSGHEPGVTIEDGYDILMMLGPRSGFCYNRESGQIVQFRGKGSGPIRMSPKPHKGSKPGLVHLGSGAESGRNAFGLTLKDDLPVEVTRIRLGGKGPGFATEDLIQLISEAETLWPTKQ